MIKLKHLKYKRAMIEKECHKSEFYDEIYCRGD